MSKRLFGLFGLMLAGMFIFAACADTAQPTATPNTSINPTAATGGAPTATPSSGPTTAPQPTAPPAEPDAEAGQATFAANCTACHNTNDQQLVGPGLAGVGTRAATTIPGKTADEYLRESIRTPADFLVDGFAPIMPPFGGLSDGEVENLIAYLKTLQ